MSADVQGKEETKLANGGGAFPFWVSVVNVAKPHCRGRKLPISAM